MRTVGVVTQSVACAADSSPWSPREMELLAVTLRLLQKYGYDGLTVDAVAATAKASKAWCLRRLQRASGRSRFRPTPAHYAAICCSWGS
jgi:Bacterial regulatory proteins, tetR family